MTEKYAHLAPENLVDAVSSIEDRLHFGSTATSDEQSREDSSLQVIDKMDERWWARKDSNLRPMDYESTVVVSKTLKTSVNRSVLRIPALRLLYLTRME